MPIATDQFDSLRSTVSSLLTTESAACRRFMVDGVTPSAVVEPTEAGELIEIIRWARSHHAALLPVSSGVYLPVGNPPAAADVAVSLARMNQVAHYDPADLTLSVQPGMLLRDVQALLAEHGLFLPADPPYADGAAPAIGAALGGLLATNASGPLRYAYGTWRDFVLGMKFVTGEGKLVKTGGRVVKNVAGYDLAKLMIGSLGTLAILTEISFKVFPLPARTATFVAGFRELEAALALRSRIVHSVLQPMSIDLLDSAAARLITSTESSPAAPAAGTQPDWLLVVSVGGVETVIDRYEKELSTRAREANAASFARLAGEEGQALLTGLRNLIPRARETHPGATIVKCTLPLTQLGAFIAKAQQVAARYQLPAAASAHAGSGIAYIYLGGPEAAIDTTKKMAQAATEMVHAGNNLGGRTTIPWCPTEVKRDVNPWGPVRDDFPLMQKLKAQFDPDRILNPGRFVGGL
ncbi:FAD-binding oxidoreductase [Acidobacteriia bacterium AH_259_A11_L15]|nr:FAD-binding oxidoreductase [Acidobacteriia bacterium AH_259_A11_L15]